MWNSIKSILKDNASKCLIIEDGEPKYVVLSFQEYQQLQGNEKNSIVEENFEEEKVNGEIQEFQTEKEEAEPVGPTIRLEDLPF